MPQVPARSVLVVFETGPVEKRKQLQHPRLDATWVLRRAQRVVVPRSVIRRPKFNTNQAVGLLVFRLPRLELLCVSGHLNVSKMQSELCRSTNTARLRKSEVN